jgi:regulatory protein SWI6
VGDLTTNSIVNRLDDTHLSAGVCTINSAAYSGQKFIQLSININKSELIILRRIDDSYINISQMFELLRHFDVLSQQQIDNFFVNNIINDTSYHGTICQYNDYRDHENLAIKGLWIPYDKAVNLAVKFDIYNIIKALFLIDVHDYDNLPQLNKRPSSDDEDTNLLKSPTKKQKRDLETTSNGAKSLPDSSNVTPANWEENNPQFPFTLQPIDVEDNDMVIDFKVKFGEVFKQDNDDNKLGYDEISLMFQPIMTKHSGYMDIPLDSKGQTALHFAATLASLNLVSAFVKLGLNSPIRGNVDGEPPLISTIQVTNSMEKGNFTELLTNWLYPNLWLYDNKKRSFLHHLALQSGKKLESCQFYGTKILQYIIGNDKYLNQLMTKIVNLQDNDGNTSLHLAIENESKWFIKLLLLLNADVNLANKSGVKPSDFEIVKEAQNEDFKDPTFDLVSTSVDFLHKRLQINDTIPEIEPLKTIIKQEKEQVDDKSSSSHKIFQSIQDLLSNTNLEYEVILNGKREQIQNLNKALHDSTIITANNRHTLKTISEKLADLDKLKLQMANITDKLQASKQEIDIPEGKNDDDDDESNEFDADEPFVIKPLYDKLINNESITELKTEDFLSQLQPTSILKARIDAYKQVNNKIEQDLKAMLNYSELTSKFKKIVSICTGVDINEVDEYLDGLLEAVEVQQ